MRSPMQSQQLQSNYKHHIPMDTKWNKKLKTKMVEQA